MAFDETNGDWYLHSQGRRFGPLSEADLRGYFRAGMVRVGDLVTLPGQSVMKTAADVAMLLNEAAPKPAAAGIATAPTIMIAPAAAVPAAILTSGAPAAAVPDIHARLPADHPALAMFNFPPTPPPKRNAWLVPVVGLVMLVAMMFIGLMFLRRFQATQLQPRQAAAQGAGESAPLPGATGGNAGEGSPADATASPPADAEAVSRAWFEKADALARSGDWPGLVAVAQQWSEAEPERNEPWLFLGSAQARLGKNAPAIFALDQVLKREPTHVVARTALADVYLQDGQNQNAATILRDLLRADPNNSRLWNNLGNALIAMDQYDESVTALETAVRIDPKNRQAWRNLGTVYQAAGYSDRAAAAFANAGAAN